MTDILRIALPFTVWVISFSSVYALNGVICEPYWQGGDIPTVGRSILIIIAGTAVTAQAGLILALGWTGAGGGSRFVERMALGLAVAALFCSVWTSLPTLMFPMCR
jgi:hypothetical protein